MAVIKINGKDFEYEEIKLSYETNSAMDHVFAKELLLKVKDIFDRNNLKFGLVYGTLLGAVRDKDFIKGDEDIDVFIWNVKKLRLIIPELYDYGIKLCRVNENLYSFMYQNSCYIDVYITRYYKFSIWGLYCFNLAGYATPKKYLKEMQSIEFQGTIFQCPKNPISLLEFWYGKTWNTPINSRGYKYEIFPAYMYKRFKNLVKNLIVYGRWRKK
jgi:phosphorylcholine metabolism protein LicD